MITRSVLTVLSTLFSFQKPSRFSQIRKKIRIKLNAFIYKSETSIYSFLKINTRKCALRPWWIHLTTTVVESNTEALGYGLTTTLLVDHRRGEVTRYQILDAILKGLLSFDYSCVDDHGRGEWITSIIKCRVFKSS